MAALYILIPVAVVIVALCIWIFFWAVDNGQYEDLDSPAHSILFDDDEQQSLKEEARLNAKRPAGKGTEREKPERD